MQLVHGNSHGFVGFAADGAVGHGAGDKALYDVLYRFHPVYADRSAVEVEEIAQEDGRFLAVYHGSELLEFLIASQACGKLQCADGFRVPGVLLTILAEGIQSAVRQ